MQVLTNFKVMVSEQTQLQQSYTQLQDEFTNTKDVYKTLVETNLRERQLYLGLKEM